MNLYFILILSAQRNNYLQGNMSVGNSKLYLGGKWANINVGEIIRFFGIMMRMLIDTRNMVGDLSYFVEDTI